MTSLPYDRQCSAMFLCESCPSTDPQLSVYPARNADSLGNRHSEPLRRRAIDGAVTAVTAVVCGRVSPSGRPEVRTLGPAVQSQLHRQALLRRQPTCRAKKKQILCSGGDRQPARGNLAGEKKKRVTQPSTSRSVQIGGGYYCSKRRKKRTETQRL